jgi:hypothetical protein
MEFENENARKNAIAAHADARDAMVATVSTTLAGVRAAIEWLINLTRDAFQTAAVSFFARWRNRPRCEGRIKISVSTTSTMTRLRRQ